MIYVFYCAKVCISISVNYSKYGDIFLCFVFKNDCTYSRWKIHVPSVFIHVISMI